MPTNVLVLNKSWMVTGAGAPEGTQFGPVGSLFLREDGGAGTSLYVKESGSGAMGWKALGSVASAPAAHHTTHELGGSDVVTLDESQVTNLVTDLAARVTGPASSLNNGIAIFSGTTGKVLKDSAIQFGNVAIKNVANVFTAANDFTGATVTAATPLTADNSTTVATTAFVKAQGYGLAGAAPAAHHATHETGGADALVALSAAILTTGLLPDARLSTNVAMLASPTFTGTPAAPTATAGTSTTQLATTAFVTTANNLKANLASPALTGTPTAPTATAGTNTTQLATTAFVKASDIRTFAGYPSDGSLWLNGMGTWQALTSTSLPTTVAYTNATNVFTASQEIDAAAPGCFLKETDQPVDQKLWKVGVENQLFTIYALNDAGANLNSGLKVTRGGDITIPTGGVTIGATPANVGAIRLENAVGSNRGVIYARNNANTGDVVVLYVNTSNQVTFEAPVLMSNIGGNVALRDQANIFTKAFAVGVWPISIQAATPMMSWVATGAAANGKLWRQYVVGSGLYIVATDDAETTNYTTFGLDRAGNATLNGRFQIGGAAISASFPAWRNTGAQMECVLGDNTNWASLKANNFTSVATGNSLADLTVTGNLTVSATATLLGGVSVSGQLTVYNPLVVSNSSSGSIQTSGPIYPGRTDTWAMQASWYLASNPNWGLYSNTGCYFVGSLLVGGNLTTNVITCTSINTQNAAISCGALTCNGITILSSAVNAQGYLCRQGTGGATSNVFNFYWASSALQMWIDQSNIGNVAIASDARMKRDFTPLAGSLEKVLQMRPGSFYFREGDIDLHLGLEAQAVTTVAPELTRNTGLVTDLTPDGMWMVNYLEMIPMLIAAIQELHAEVTWLKSR